MKICIDNCLAEIVEGTEEEVTWARDCLSISEPQFRKNYKTGRIEYKETIKTSLIDDKTKQFPSGLARILWKQAKKAEPPIPLKVDDKRITPSVEPIDIDLSYLRDYQLDAVNACLKFKRGILHHATAAGKTIVAMALVTKVPIKWMFLVQDTDLLHQAADVYEKRTGMTAGKIGDGTFDVSEDTSFIVATAQTLNSRVADDRIWNLIQEVEGIIVDEAHGLPATTMYNVAMSAKKAYYRIGLSGTPLSRSDKKSIYTIGALGTVIHRARADELIEKGFLSKPTISMSHCTQDSSKRTLQGVYGELIVRSNKRNKLLTQLALEANKPNLTFVKEIKHGQALTKMYEKAGLTVEFMWGGKQTIQRKNAIQRLIRGDIDCIICSIFQQGVDLPELESVVMAAAGKSDRLTLQRIGRGMRVTGDKKTFQVFDIFDIGQKWLENHSVQRLKSYKSEGHTATLVEEPK